MSNQFNIGSKVAVLDDTIKGEITSIDGRDITINTEDEFLMIFDKDDLVLIENEQKDFSKYIDIKHGNLVEKEEPNKKYTERKQLKRKKQPPLEVDLHIHQLTNSSKRMSNYEILTLQIETAKRRLEFAIKKKIARVVFIHGVGEGVLKKELEFLLDKYSVEVYPASFQKYGFGATEVYIYQNKK